MRPAHQGKVEKYSAVREISQFLRETTGLEPLFSALAVNWRGVIAPQSAADLREVGITKRELKLLSLITVEQTALIHRHFYQSTCTRGFQHWFAHVGLVHDLTVLEMGVVLHET